MVSGTLFAPLLALTDDLSAPVGAWSYAASTTTMPYGLAGSSWEPAPAKDMEPPAHSPVPSYTTSAPPHPSEPTSEDDRAHSVSSSPSPRSRVADPGVGAPSDGHSHADMRSSSSHHNDDDEERPPRPPNAWMLYRSAKFREMERNRADRSPTEGASSSASTSKPRNKQAEVSRIVSTMWRDEPAEVKERYQAMAEERKREHLRMHPGYKYRPRKSKAAAAKAKAKERGGETGRISSSPTSASRAARDLATTASHVALSSLDSSICETNVFLPRPRPDASGMAPDVLPPHGVDLQALGFSVTPTPTPSADTDSIWSADAQQVFSPDVVFSDPATSPQSGVDRWLMYNAAPPMVLAPGTVGQGLAIDVPSDAPWPLVSVASAPHNVEDFHHHEALPRPATASGTEHYELQHRQQHGDAPQGVPSDLSPTADQQHFALASMQAGGAVERQIAHSWANALRPPLRHAATSDASAVTSPAWTMPLSDVPWPSDAMGGAADVAASNAPILSGVASGYPVGVPSGAVAWPMPQLSPQPSQSPGPVQYHHHHGVHHQQHQQHQHQPEPAPLSAPPMPSSSSSSSSLSLPGAGWTSQMPVASSSAAPSPPPPTQAWASSQQQQQHHHHHPMHPQYYQYPPSRPPQQQGGDARTGPSQPNRHEAGSGEGPLHQ